MVKCCGQTEACMKVNGAEVFNMVLVVLYFQMEHSKRVTSKTMFTSTQSKLECKHKCVQQKLVPVFKQTLMPKIHISLTSLVTNSLKLENYKILDLKIFRIKQSLQEQLTKLTIEIFSSLTQQFQKVPTLAPTTQTSFIIKTVPLVRLLLILSVFTMMDQQIQQTTQYQDHN